MTLYTIGFTQKSAEQFFGLLRRHGVQMLVDVRLNNRTQLAGFTKGDDLSFFLRALCACGYSHRDDFSPDKELLKDYRKGSIGWDAYAARYIALMEQRGAPQRFLRDYGAFERAVLLCSEPTPERCHRRLLAELIAEADPAVGVIHL